MNMSNTNKNMTLTTEIREKLKRVPNKQWISCSEELKYKNIYTLHFKHQDQKLSAYGGRAETFQANDTHDLFLFLHLLIFCPIKKNNKKKPHSFTCHNTPLKFKRKILKNHSRNKLKGGFGIFFLSTITTQSICSILIHILRLQRGRIYAFRILWEIKEIYKWIFLLDTCIFWCGWAEGGWIILGRDSARSAHRASPSAIKCAAVALIWSIARIATESPRCTLVDILSSFWSIINFHWLQKTCTLTRRSIHPSSSDVTAKGTT